MKMIKFTGERVVPHQMDEKTNILVEHIARYNFALDYIKDAIVLDAASGTGYGMEIMSWVAKDVLGFEINEEACLYSFSRFSKIVNGVDLDDEKDLMAQTVTFDVVTSFETIEHLKNPKVFLGWVASKKVPLIFSVPINQPSEFHKTVFHSPSDVQSLMSEFFPSVKLFAQIYTNFYSFASDAKYVVGIASFDQIKQ